MFSVSRSPLALVTQTFFLGLHGAGLLLGAVYNQKTPDLYPNNAHNKIGWIVTWIVVVQCTIGLIRFVVSAAKIHDVSAEEQTAFLPISTEALAQHYQIQAMRFPEQHRYSHDSGHCTASEPSRSQSISSQGDEEEQQKLREYRDECLPGPVDSGKHGWVWKARIQNVASKISATIPSRTLRVMNAVYDAIDCLSLLFGFVAIMTGAVVYGGVFVSFKPRVNFRI